MISAMPHADANRIVQSVVGFRFIRQMRKLLCQFLQQAARDVIIKKDRLGFGIRSDRQQIAADDGNNRASFDVDEKLVPIGFFPASADVRRDWHRNIYRSHSLCISLLG